MNKLMMQGVVLCPCGVQIISNSGKTIADYHTKQLFCWGCNKGYNWDAVYEARQENQTVTFNPDVSLNHGAD